MKQFTSKELQGSQENKKLVKMMNRKSIREKGKIRLSEYFKELKIGDEVAIVKEPSIAASFPLRIGGRTGIIEGMRGKAYIVKLRDFQQEKRFIVEAIHLKKLGK